MIIHIPITGGIGKGIGGILSAFVKLNRKEDISNGKQNYFNVWFFWEKVSQTSGLDYKYLRKGKHISLNLVFSRSSQFSYFPFFTWNGGDCIYKYITYNNRTSAVGNFEFLIVGCGYKLIKDSKNIDREQHLCRVA